MGKFKYLVKLAFVAGPAVAKVVTSYGPAIKTMISRDPANYDKLASRINTTLLMRSRRGLPTLEERLTTLREHVTYLYGTANTPLIAAQAVKWRDDIDQMIDILPLVRAMSPKLQRKEVKTLDKRIDSLSTKILAATLQDDIEDAEIIDDDAPAGTPAGSTETAAGTTGTTDTVSTERTEKGGTETPGTAF